MHSFFRVCVGDGEGYGPHCSIELLSKCVCVCVTRGRDMDHTIVLNVCVCETREEYGPYSSIELLNERMRMHYCV